jgi:hypothetical protein
MVGTVRTLPGFSTRLSPRLLMAACDGESTSCGLLSDLELLVSLGAAPRRVCDLVRSVRVGPTVVNFPALIADDLTGLAAGLPDPGPSVAGWLLWRDDRPVGGFTAHEEGAVLISTPDGCVRVSAAGVRLESGSVTWPVSCWSHAPDGGVAASSGTAGDGAPDLPERAPTHLLAGLAPPPVHVRPSPVSEVWRWQLETLLHACARAVTRHAPLTLYADDQSSL